ncbi:MAG: hypothetical protein JRG79_09245 [Deltaproteobacteria bacterium]|nr:hypothetical protein [Deltaproteobacteria bacterium]
MEAQDFNDVGDVVLIHYQDQPTLYARIEAIEPDVKKDWYQVTFLFLTLPAQTVTWILREGYINGEMFTMGGQPVRLEKVPWSKPLVEGSREEPVKDGEKSQGSAKVIPLKRKQ